MLVLTRKANESIVIDGDIRVTVTAIRGGHIRLGIEAPRHVKVYREELCMADCDHADLANLLRQPAECVEEAEALA